MEKNEKRAVLAVPRRAVLVVPSRAVLAVPQARCVGGPQARCVGGPQARCVGGPLKNFRLVPERKSARRPAGRAPVPEARCVGGPSPLDLFLAQKKLSRGRRALWAEKLPVVAVPDPRVRICALSR